MKTEDAVRQQVATLQIALLARTGLGILISILIGALICMIVGEMVVMGVGVSLVWKIWKVDISVADNSLWFVEANCWYVAAGMAVGFAVGFRTRAQELEWRKELLRSLQ